MPDPTPKLDRCIIDPAGRWILCVQCNRKSNHPQDVAERFCGRCHRFLSDGDAHEEP